MCKNMSWSYIWYSKLNDLGNNKNKNYFYDIIKEEKNGIKKTNFRIREFNTPKDNLSKNKNYQVTIQGKKSSNIRPYPI